MSIKSLLLCFSMLASLPAFAQQKLVTQPKAVVELFTSQGCSACPPADQLFGAMRGRDDLILLSWSVDLWDYLGWKDTLADASFTKRQRGYAATQGGAKVYTPQMILSGHTVVPTIEKTLVDRKIKEISSFAFSPTLTLSSQKLEVSLPNQVLNKTDQVTMIAAIFVSSTKSVLITRGENRGKTITYNHVVRGLVPLGGWEGEAKTVELALDKVPADVDRVVILVQTKDDKLQPKAILSAAQVVLR